MDAIIAVQLAEKHATKIKDALKPKLAAMITDEFLIEGFWMDRITPTAWFATERELVGLVYLIMYNYSNDKIEMKKEKELAELPDDQNPVYIFSLTSTELLLQISDGEIDAVDYARAEISNRGIGKNGVWVGFREAKRQWGEVVKK